MPEGDMPWLNPQAEDSTMLTGIFLLLFIVQRSSINKSGLCQTKCNILTHKLNMDPGQQQTMAI